MNSRLDGRVALVIDGSHGIGAAIARALAEAGADVAITYRDDLAQAYSVVTDLAILGARSTSYRFDGADFAMARTILQSLVRTLGGFDILVANADAIGSATGNPGHFEIDEHVVCRDIGPLLFLMAGVDLLRDGGSIIAVSTDPSDALALGGDPEAPRGRVHSRVKELAVMLAERRITANAVIFQPPSSTQLDVAEAGNMPDVVEEGAPLTRYDEVAATIAILASPAACYITGNLLTIDA